MARRLTAQEAIAPIVFFDRYVAHDGDPIAFYASLSPAEHDAIDQIVRAVTDAITGPDPDDAPPCPKRCDVASRPESIGPDRWLCSACGTEYTAAPAPRMVLA